MSESSIITNASLPHVDNQSSRMTDVKKTDLQSQDSVEAILKSRENAFHGFDWGSHQIVLPGPPGVPCGPVASSYPADLPEPNRCMGPLEGHPIIALWDSGLSRSMIRLLDANNVPFKTMMVVRRWYHTGAPNEMEEAPTYISVAIDGPDVDEVSKPDAETFIKQATALLKSHQLDNIFVEVYVTKFWGGMASQRRR